MPTPIDWKRWNLYQRTIEACLREGFDPPNQSGGKGSAVEEAQRRLVASGHLVLGKETRSVLRQWTVVQERRVKRGLEHRLPNWKLRQNASAVRIEPTSRVVERYILTSAQNDTPVHGPFLTNLKALAGYYGARMHVGRFTYQTAMAAGRARKKTKEAERRERAWAPALAGELTSERIGLGGLIFAAEMNTLPTAARPLSSLHTYGQGKTCIFPHAKVALETVPIGGDGLPPVVLTTGCCTVPSYTDTKAGHKAQFHHILGAVVVEIDSEKRTFFRHVIGKIDGAFQDLDLVVSGGHVSAGNRVEAITYGDLQLPFLDPGVAEATWGVDADTLEPMKEPGDVMIDALRPRFGFYHDAVDFKSISHHDEKRPRERFRTYLEGGHLVEGDLMRAARFFGSASREWQKAVIIESNHGRWLERWLDRCDHRNDRANALAFLRWERARYEAEAAGDPDFNVFKYALTEACDGDLPAEFVPDGGSYVICQSTGGIECGAHGDLGPNGSPGTTTALAKVSGKANVGDGHSPTITDGLYRAGTSSKLRLGFNKGPSSWRHAHVLTYPTGKRALILIEDNRWRA